MLTRVSLPLLLLALVCTHARAEDEKAVAFTDEQITFFETKIRPVLANNCYSCHSHEAKRNKGGFYMDSREGILEAFLAEPGKPAESMMIEAVHYKDPSMQMPPAGKLPDNVIKDLEKWVEMGLPWPDESGPAVAEVFDLEQRRKDHWAWKAPSRSIKPPKAPGLSSDANPIDKFVEARLAAGGLKPAEPASREVLIRRLTHDLTGLPPTPGEIEAFINDKSPKAYEKLVDRLLAHKAFGEKWGRHWLDSMRYAEAYGHEFDYSIPHPWVYRNAVINAINNDIPYDRFVKEHIAGDQVEPRPGDPMGNESIKMTGWWYLHEQTHSPTDVRLHEADRIDNQIDVLSKTFLGMTIACARCHDHKFDAIGDEDYYAMAGFLQSSRQQEAYIGHKGMAEHLEKVGKLAEYGQKAFERLKAEPLKPTAYNPEKPDASRSALFEDFNEDEYENGWSATGWAWGDRPTVPGQWDPTSGKAAPVMPGVAHSGLNGKEAVGTLRSPEFDVTHRHLWLLVKGKGKARLIIDGYTMARHNGLLFSKKDVNVDTKGKWQWVELITHFDFHTEGNHRAFVEIIDDDKNAYLMIDEVRTSPRGPAPPMPDMGHIVLDSVKPSEDKRFADYTKRFNEQSARIPNHSRALAIVDGSPEDSYVHVRGSWHVRGETMPRRTLEALGGKNESSPADRSGRLELAQSIVDPSNPLTARVQVNRLWHHLFGTGIVPTVDNFGVLGIAPSHPELLDYLAVTFMHEDKWSNKAMIKRIVMSRAYQRSSDKTDAAAEEKDPTNILLHRQNIRRLTAEGIRDTILAVSGSLRKDMHGRSEPVHLTSAMDGRGRPKSGPLDGAGYRSIYISVRRNFLSPMMLTFDRPIPFTAIGRRTITNVPAQSLTLMNDPFVHEQAVKWSQRQGKDGAKTVQERVDNLWMKALGRMPSEEERTAAIAFLKEASGNPDLSDQDALNKGRWNELCHAIFNLKEFIFIR